MKYIGIILIIFQLISHFGNISAGKFFLPPLSPSGIAFFIGQNIFAIIGIILIWLDARRKKATSNTNQTTQEQSFYETLDSVDHDSENK
jgi:hypothetical protein